MVIGKLLRFLLTVMSLASFLVGAALSAVGIWIVSNKDQLRSLLNLVRAQNLPALEQPRAEAEALLTKYDVISTIGIVIIILGSFIAFVSICGGLGAMCDIKILLIVYILITGALLISLVVALIYFGTLKARMASELQKRLSELQETYMVSVVSMLRNKEAVNAAVTVAFNAMQLMLKCCGMNTIGDARNSTSWLQSERRIRELIKDGADILPPLASVGLPSSVRLVQAQAPAAAAAAAASGKPPKWLEEHLPRTITKLPDGMQTLPQLPDGFKLPPDFKDKLAKLDPSKLVNFKESFEKLLDDELTLKTPLTCCEMGDLADELIKGKYDVKQVFKNIKQMSCAFSASNVGVNQKTCHQAYMDYISRYQHYVITVGTILAIIMGAGVFSGLWILLFE